MITPHGGKLVNRQLEGNKLEIRADEVKELPAIIISQDTYEELENIATGVFSPIEGFMNREELTSLVERDRLPDDTVWTMPVLLDADGSKARELSDGQEVVLMFNGEAVGLLHLEEVFEFDKKKLAEHVFRTTDEKHPGVANLYSMQDKLLGGKVDLIKELNHPYKQYHLKPVETRKLFKKKGWKRVVGFQTRNVPHMGHELVQKTSLAIVDGVFINPVIGKKKKGDFLDSVILGAYVELMKYYYPPDRVAMSILKTRMRYGGPKEAIFHSIVRKNFGCTHFIVGRDHAGVGNYYGPYEAQEIFSDFPDLEVTPIFFKSFYHCKKCYSAVMDSQCPHGEEYQLNFSGTKIRGLLSEKKRPERELMRPEVADYIIRQEKLFVD